MPSINLGPRTRFALYLLGSLASLGVVYAVDKSWAGDAETRLVQGLVALLGILAAANTNTSGDKASVTGTVTSETGETGTIAATIGDADAEPAPLILGKAFTGGAFSQEAEDARAARNTEDDDPHRP